MTSEPAPAVGVSREALTATESPWSIQTLLGAMLLAALLVGNIISLQAFVVVVVTVAGFWAWDLADFAARAGNAINAYALFATIGAVAWGSYVWGFEGFAGGLILGVAVGLVWAVAVAKERELARLTETILGTLLVAMSVGPLILLRMRWDVEVNAFLFVIAVALAASMAALLFQDRIPLLDPNISALVGAALAGLIAGSVSSLSLSVTFVAAVSASGGLVAGRTAGSLLRSGEVRLLERAPGALSMLDGPMLAAGIYWLAVITLSG